MLFPFAHPSFSGRAIRTHSIEYLYTHICGPHGEETVSGVPNLRRYESGGVRTGLQKKDLILETDGLISAHLQEIISTEIRITRGHITLYVSFGDTSAPVVDALDVIGPVKQHPNPCGSVCEPPSHSTSLWHQLENLCDRTRLCPHAATSTNRICLRICQF